MSACRKENKLRFVLLLKPPAATFTWKQKGIQLIKQSVSLPDAAHVFGSVNHLGSCTKNSLGRILAPGSPALVCAGKFLVASLTRGSAQRQAVQSV